VHALELVIGLCVAAVLLSAAARKVGAPYPVFLALGGALIAFVPGVPVLNIPPDLALALFVAPILLDAAHDASLRDLKDNWAPVTSLAVIAVALTTFAVALVAEALVPAMPWAAAIALGAIVSPPDAVAAIAVLRHLNPPHRILTILEGESLINDATALLIYRLAVGAAIAGTFRESLVAPTFLLAIAGGLLAGPVLGWITVRLMGRVTHVPSAIILQFVTTFGIWILAERLGLSAILTTVSYAVTVSRSPERVPARLRIPTYAVWETTVFALNTLAFIFIGLQMRPIFETLEVVERDRYLGVAGAVLLTVILVRPAWHMTFNAVVQWRHRRYGYHPPRPLMRPTTRSGLLISWAGMRGIVTLAAAMALPEGFPYRDLIMVTSFAVVLGTLTLQGMTLKPLLRKLDIRDDDPVGRETGEARKAALVAGLTALAKDYSPAAQAVRNQLKATLASQGTDAKPIDGMRVAHTERQRLALDAAREAVVRMRAAHEIGDDAYHAVEEQLDWLEMTTGPADE
jgi:Na+/H+ antiporter